MGGVRRTDRDPITWAPSHKGEPGRVEVVMVLAPSVGNPLITWSAQRKAWLWEVRVREEKDGPAKTLRGESPSPWAALMALLLRINAVQEDE